MRKMMKVMIYKRSKVIYKYKYFQLRKLFFYSKIKDLNNI